MSSQDEWERKKFEIVVFLFDKGAVDGETYTVRRETIGESVGLQGERLERALVELSQSGVVHWVEEQGTWFCYLTLVGVQTGKLLEMKRDRAMSQGDVLWAYREQVLKSLYHLGAISEGMLAGAPEVKEGIESIPEDPEDRRAVVNLLISELLVAHPREGGYQLTAEGFKEARRVVERLRSRVR